MKKEYTTPKITVDLLMKTDALMASFETDNSYAKSRSIFNDDFTVDDIL